LGGITGFAIVAIVLDILFAAAMIAVAVLTRDGADSCRGDVQTPLGDGPATANNGFGGNGFGGDQGENYTYAVDLGTACKLNTAVFAVAIIAAFLFLCTAAMQVMLMRHHKKEKRLGPSPSNNYTSGYGKGLFSRKKKTAPVTKDAEAGTVGAEPVPVSNGYTNGTNGYTNTATHGHSGYYTAPTGTAASNPYGYNNTSTNY
jgi:hypothetical protein